MTQQMFELKKEMFVVYARDKLAIGRNISMQTVYCDHGMNFKEYHRFLIGIVILHRRALRHASNVCMHLLSAGEYEAGKQFEAAKVETITREVTLFLI